MNIKKTLLAATAALIIAPAASFAADFPVTVSVEAVVPAADGLQVSPVNGWDKITQKMTWSLASQELEPIRQQIDVKSNAAIKAYLVDDAVLTSGANSIPLVVALHGKTLSSGAANGVELLTESEAAASRRIDASISATKPATGGYIEGNYAGLVHMMFESTVTTR